MAYSTLRNETKWYFAKRSNKRLCVLIYFIPKINYQLPVEKWAHESRRNLCSWFSSSESCPYEKRVRAGAVSFWVPFLQPYRSRHMNYRNHFRSKIRRSRQQRQSFPTVIANCSTGSLVLRGFSCHSGSFGWIISFVMTSRFAKTVYTSVKMNPALLGRRWNVVLIALSFYSLLFVTSFHKVPFHFVSLRNHKPI